MKQLILVFFALGLLSVNAQATDNSGMVKNTNILCKYYGDFKAMNVVLCSMAEQMAEGGQPIGISKELACLYPSVQADERICTVEENKAMALPPLPYHPEDLPTWKNWMGNTPALMTVINGKALSKILTVDEDHYSNEYSVETECASATGKLKDTDRILCGAVLKDLPLVKAGNIEGDAKDALIESLKKEIELLEAAKGLSKSKK